MKESIKRKFLLVLGLLCVVLGLLGIVLPVLPTTPFALLAAFFFSRSSEKMHLWLLEQKHLGPLIKSWQLYGAISFKAKLLATFLMIILFSYTLIFTAIIMWIKILLIFVAIGVLVFIWTRPIPPPLPVTNKTLD